MKEEEMSRECSTYKKKDKYMLGFGKATSMESKFLNEYTHHAACLATIP